MALWGGRFSQSPTEAVFALSQSVQFDWRLAPYDLRSSLAHLAVLESSGLLEKKVVAAIRKALEELVEEVASGKFTYGPTDEDVHSALERGLTEKLGEIGGMWKNTAGRYEIDGKKIYAKQILKEPEVYFTDEVMQKLDVIAKGEYSYGS